MCTAMLINLCLVDLTKQVACVRNIFGTLQSLYNFIKASSKRNEIYENMCLNASKVNGPKSLKKLCETRWLELIYENDIVSRGEAKSLMNNILNFEFIFCL